MSQIDASSSRSDMQPDDLGWVSCRDRMPANHERVEVANENDRFALSNDRGPFGPITGHVEAGGFWTCSAYFVTPRGTLIRNPSHWRPMPSDQALERAGGGE